MENQECQNNPDSAGTALFLRILSHASLDSSSFNHRLPMLHSGLLLRYILEGLLYYGILETSPSRSIKQPALHLCNVCDSNPECNR